MLSKIDLLRRIDHFTHSPTTASYTAPIYLPFETNFPDFSAHFLSLVLYSGLFLSTDPHMLHFSAYCAVFFSSAVRVIIFRMFKVEVDRNLQSLKHWLARMIINEIIKFARIFGVDLSMLLRWRTKLVRYCCSGPLLSNYHLPPQTLNASFPRRSTGFLYCLYQICCGLWPKFFFLPERRKDF